MRFCVTNDQDIAYMSMARCENVVNFVFGLKGYDSKGGYHVKVLVQDLLHRKVPR